MGLDIYSIYTDGAARGNPGQSASGFNIYKNNILIKSFFKYNSINTNNYAEYTAIILSLKWSFKNLSSENQINLYSDSELVINQINQKYKVKSIKLIDLYNKACKLKVHFKNINFIHVNRINKKIAIVDKNLNLFLDKTLQKHQLYFPKNNK